jgi:hypothetical protein
MTFFLQPNFPGYEPVGLQTPEEAFPIYGLLSGYESVAQGVADLNTRSLRRTPETTWLYLAFRKAP